MIRASRDLRHVHHRLQVRLLARGGEGRGCKQKAIGERIREVRTLHPIQRRTHGLVVANIADGDFGAELPELIGPFISLANERPHGHPPREQLPRHVVASGPMTSTRADNQETRGTRLRHLRFLLEVNNRYAHTEAARFSNSSVPDMSPTDIWAPQHPQLRGIRPRGINSPTDQPLRIWVLRRTSASRRCRLFRDKR